MKLFHKTIISVFITFAVVFLSLLLSIRWITQRGFTALEASYVLQSAKTLQYSLQNTLLHLRVLTLDWATWDDTYRFMEDRNQAYVDGNIVNSTFRNAQLNAIVYVDTTGGVVFAKGYDLVRDDFTPVSTSLLALVTARLGGGAGTLAGAGLVRLSEGPVLLTAAPILTSAGNGPSRGTLVFSSPFEEGFMRSPVCASLTGLRYFLLGESSTIGPFGELHDAWEAGHDFFLREESSSEVMGFRIMRDMDRHPILALAFTSPRIMKQQQGLVVSLLSAALIGMGLVFALLSILFIRRMIVGRLMVLNRAVQRVTETGKLQNPVPEQGRDEIADLGHSFNRMMDALAKAQAELAEHDEYLNILFNSLHVGMLVIDTETHRITDANEYALAKLGLERSAVCGHVCQKFVCPTVAGHCPVADLHREVDLSETTLLRPGQPPVPILKSVVPVTRNGRRLHVESFIDISRLKAVELELRSRMEIEAAIAQISVDFIRSTPPRMEGIVSGALCRIGELTEVDRIGLFQLSRDQMRLIHVSEWCRAGVESCADRLQNVRADDFPWWMGELRRLKPVYVADIDQDTRAGNAPERELLLSLGIRGLLAVPLQNEGNLLGFLAFDMMTSPKTWLKEDINLLRMLAGAFSGVLIRQEYEQALQTSAERYQAIFENSGAGCMLVDEAGGIILVNQVFLTMTGLPENELVGQSWLECVDPADRLSAAKLMETSCPSNDEAPFLTLRLVTRRYQDLYARTALTHMPESKDWIISFADITDRQHAEMALQKANRIKSEFLANMSHEIRSPLNSIIGYAELIREAANVEKSARYAQTILDESDDLLALINDVLDNAKLDAGKMSLHYAPFVLANVLAGLESDVRVRIRKDTLEFHVYADPALPACLIGDERRLRQVLLNLLVNAVKFTEQGSIVLRINRVPEIPYGIRYTVADTGVGIPRDKQDAIFESFTQVDGGSNRKFTGTGLGITIAQKLVQLMGGKIQVQSEVGRGSTFWFDISQRPSDAPTPARAEEPASPQTLAEGHVLVVEDSPVILTLVRMHLENMGYSVHTAVGGREALALCEKQPFDLILMDLQMPEMDGLETTRRIRKSSSINKHAPVVAVTANVSGSIREDCLAAGLNDVLSKPFRKKALLQTVERWIATLPVDLRGSEEKETADTAAENASGSEPASPLIYSQALYEFSGNKNLLQNVLDQFVGGLPSQMDQLRTAVQKEDFAAAAFIAHKICGGAGNLTAYPLSKAAAELETRCRDQKRDEAPAWVEQVGRECGRLRDFVAQRGSAFKP